MLDIGQGAGLAGATGVRPFLPPLLAGALARADAGIDFEKGSFSFLEEPAFLVAVLALTVVAYFAERRRRPPPPEGRGRTRDEVALATVAAALGALLFAGALTQDGGAGWPGLPAGAVCALLGYAAVAALFARARRRLDAAAGGLLTVYGDALALGIAALSVFAPVAGFVALVAFAVLLVRARGSDGRKFEGLRVLR